MQILDPIPNRGPGPCRLGWNLLAGLGLIALMPAKGLLASLNLSLKALGQQPGLAARWLKQRA